MQVSFDCVHSGQHFVNVGPFSMFMAGSLYTIDSPAEPVQIIGKQ